MQNNYQSQRLFATCIIWITITLLVILPLLLMLCISFMPYDDNNLWHLGFTLNSYKTLFTPTYAKIFYHSFTQAFFATFICFIIGYPTAYALSKIQINKRFIALLFIIIPFWTSSLIRTYATMAIIKSQGLLNSLLLELHIIHQPMALLYTKTAVLAGLVYSLLPFMILPIYTNLEKIDRNLFAAARDLGANKLQIATKILLPLSTPGILSGTILVFLPAMTLFYIPVLLGGAKDLLVGNLIDIQFLTMHNWPSGAATGVILTLTLLLFSFIYRLLTKRWHEAIR